MDIDPDRAKTYGRYRQALKTERDLKPAVRALALDDLRAGVTVSQLAEATGMTREVFRRIARDNDIPVDARYQERAEKFRARSAGGDDAEVLDRPTPRPVTPLLGMSEPPAELGLAAVIAKMSRPAAKILMKPVAAERPDWITEQRAKFAAVEDRWLTHALLQAAVNAGYVELPAT